MPLLARWRTSTSPLAGRLPALLRSSAYPAGAPAGWLFKHHGGGPTIRCQSGIRWLGLAR
jgi:hypothetical protein